MAAVAVLMAGLADIPGIEEQRLSGAGLSALQRQRLEIEVLLPSEGQLVGCQGVQFFIRRHAKVDAAPPLECPGSVLRDSDYGEIA